jgi:hypothetical protein
MHSEDYQVIWGLWHALHRGSHSHEWLHTASVDDSIVSIRLRESEDSNGQEIESSVDSDSQTGMPGR